MKEKDRASQSVPPATRSTPDWRWVAALAVLGFALAARVHGGGTESWETAWMIGMRADAPPAITAVARLVTTAGSPGGLVALALIVIALQVAFRRQTDALWLLAALAGAGALQSIIKRAVQRSRPEVVAHLTPAAGYSFPSGHATTAIAFFGALALVLTRTTSLRRGPVYAACGLAALAVGLSRVYLGVHWPTDVIGGYLFGGAYLAVLVRWVGGQARP